jgi:mRNA-degrading endonuclease RelE of RelBE toxin-antitoxin system
LETRNKKLLRENPLADWELRVHPFRVFYDVDEANKSVRVLAIGVKDGDKLIVGGEEIDI